MSILQRYRWIVLWGGLASGGLRAAPQAEERIVLMADGPVHAWFHGTQIERVVARDNVEVQYRGIVLHGDRLQADFQTNEMRLEGNVTATTQGQTLVCEAIRFNLKTRDYSLENGRLTLTPDFIGGGVIAPLFVGGKQAQARGEEEIQARGPQVTSCDREHPHFLLSGKRVVIYPGRKLLLWGGSFSVLGRRLVSLPKIEIPLRNLRRGLPLTPDFGRNDVEGFYLKTHYQLPTSSLNRSTGTQLDLTEKQGIRLGLEHQYRSERQRQGWIDLDYALKDRALSARVNHLERFSREFDVDLGMDYNERNVFAYQKRQLNAHLRLKHYTSLGSSSTLAVRRQSSDGRDSLSANLMHQSSLKRSQRGGRGVQASLNADYYRRPTFGGGVDDEEINTRLTLTGEAPRFRWTLQDERRFDPDGEAYTQDNFYAYTEMVPHLTLMSDARQLHWGLPPNMSSTMQLSLGQFREMTRRNDQPRQVDVFRTNFQMNLRASRIPLSGSLSANADLGFEQSFFSDQTAKYNLRSNTSLLAELGPGWNLQLTHFYQRPSGYSPLSRFDFTSRSDRLTAALHFSADRRTGTFGWGGYGGYGGYESYGGYGGFSGEEGAYRSRAAEEEFEGVGYGQYDAYGGYRRVGRGRQPWQISLNTGYDLLRSRWNSMGINANGSLSPSSRIGLNTRYDFQGQGFGDVNVQWNYAGSHLLLDSSLLYSPRQRTKLSAVRSFVSWEASRKVRLETLLEYRGQERKLTYNDVLLTYDLHCWEAVLVYNKQRGDFRLDFNLKAYPRSDFGFGVGRFGQGFDTSLGGYY
jgi:hypothetical protein